MKFGFVTCVRLGLSCMEAMHEAGVALSVVITLPDDTAQQKSGRVYLDNFCSTQKVPLVKTKSINDETAIEAIREHDIDWLFIIGWSQIAGANVLAAPNKGAIGMHPTLLPQGRGRAAIPWAILKDLSETGVTLFKIDGGIDTGPIGDQVVVPLKADTTARSLYNAIDIAHQDLIRKTAPALLEDCLTFTPQDDSKATVWPGRKPQDGEIDLNGSVYVAERLVRAVSDPYPGAFVQHANEIIPVKKACLAPPNHPASENVLTFPDGKLIILE